MIRRRKPLPLPRIPLLPRRILLEPPEPRLRICLGRLTPPPHQPPATRLRLLPAVRHIPERQGLPALLIPVRREE